SKRAVGRSVFGSASYGRTMVKKNRRQGQHLLRGLLFAVAVAGSSVALGAVVGCRVSDTDVKRWGTTEHGPDKLVAVLTHDKYEWPLRVEAALELLRMKPRLGRRVGIQRLVDAMAQLSPEERKRIIDGMLPQLVAGITQPPPAAPPGQPTPPDLSYMYKD